jgi:chromosome segregation ATPase
LRRAESQQSEVIGTVARVSIDLESMREVVATSFPKINTELVTLQESMDDYHSRLEIMQATLTMLHSEQNKTYKVLKAWNSQFKDLREMVAALPSIEKEQAEVRNELTEWKSRFNAASEVLAEFLQSDDLPNERLPTSDAPTTQ